MLDTQRSVTYYTASSHDLHAWKDLPCPVPGALSDQNTSSWIEGLADSFCTFVRQNDGLIGQSDSQSWAVNSGTSDSHASQTSPSTIHNSPDSDINKIRCRAKGPTANQWAENRPVIQEIYLQPGTTLKDVQQYMLINYDFDASEQMYKKRLSYWGCRKNCSRAIVVSHLSRCQRARLLGRCECLLTIGGRQVPQRKIRRLQAKLVGLSPAISGGSEFGSTQLQSKACLATLYEDELPTSIISSPANGPIFHGLEGRLPPLTSFTVDRCGPQQSYNVESLVVTTRDFLLDYKPTENIDLETSSPLRTFLNDIQNAGQLLGNKSPRAFTLLHRVCEQLTWLMKLQAFQVLIETLLTLMRKAWDNFLSVKASLLEYMVSVALQVLPPYHPLQKVYLCLMREGASKHAVGPLSRMLTHLLRQRSGEHGTGLLALQLDAIKVAMDSDLLDDAEALCLDTISAAENSEPPNHNIIRMARKRLAEVYWLQYYDSKSEEAYLEVLRLTTQIFGVCNGDEIGTKACRKLGALYKHKSDFVSSERYIKLAFEGALRIFGAKDSSTYAYLNGWKTVLQKLGKDEDVTQLDQDYAHIRLYWSQAYQNPMVSGRQSLN